MVRRVFCGRRKKKGGGSVSLQAKKNKGVFRIRRKKKKIQGLFTFYWEVFAVLYFFRGIFLLSPHLTTQIVCFSTHPATFSGAFCHAARPIPGENQSCGTKLFFFSVSKRLAIFLRLRTKRASKHAKNERKHTAFCHAARHIPGENQPCGTKCFFFRFKTFRHFPPPADEPGLKTPEKGEKTCTR